MDKKTTANLNVQIKQQGGKRTTNVVNDLNKGMKDATSTQERMLRGSGEMSSNQTKNFSKMSQGLSGVVHVYASLAANIFAVSAAFRLLSDAADYQRMIRASEQLSIKTGNNFAAVARSLKEVSAGAIDMQFAMQTANLGLAAGFSGGQMEKITKLATQAGIALGRSVPDAISRLSTAIVKGEPELTDELGIILRLKEATDDYAAARGKVAKDLSTGERLQAVYEQAIERGTPKYGAIDIEPQAYDKLLSSIKEVSKVFANLVNNILSPFVKILGESKLILGAMFLILGKILLTKTTHLFGDGLENRLSLIKERFKGVLEVSEKASKKNTFFTNLLSAGKQFGDDINDVVGNSLRNIKGAKQLPNIMKKSMKDADIGRAFLSSLEPSVRKQLPDMITESIEAGAKNLQFKNKDKLVSIPLDNAKNIAQASQVAEAVENYNDMLEAQKRMDTWWGKILVRVESLSAAYTNFETKLKASALYGLEAGLTKGTDKYRENLVKVNALLVNSNNLTRKLALGSFKIAFAIGKVGRGLDLFAGLMSKAIGWAGAIFMAFGMINKLTGMWSGNLSKSNDLLKESTEITEGIEKTLNSVIINPDDMNSLAENIKKTANAILQYTTAIEKAGKAINTAAKMSKLEKIWDTLFDEGKIKEGAKVIRDNLSEAILGIKSFPGGDKAVQDMMENLSLDKIKIKTTIELDIENIDKINTNYNERLEKVKQMEQILFSTSIGNKSVLANMEKELANRKESFNIAKSEMLAIKEARAAHMTGVGKTIQIERKASDLLKERGDIYEALKSGDIERIADTIEFIKKIEESEGAAGLLDAVLAHMNSTIQIATTNAKELANTLVTAAQTIASILQGYSQVKEAKLLGDIIKGRAEISALEDSLLDDIAGKSFTQIVTGTSQLKALKASVQIMEDMRSASIVSGEQTWVNKIDKELTTLQKKKTVSPEQIENFVNKQAGARVKLQTEYEKSRLAYIGYLNDTTDKSAEATAELSNILRLNKEINKVTSVMKEGGAVKSKARKSGGGGGKHKPQKYRGKEAQVELEYLRAIQVVAEQNLKSANTSGKVRVAAAQKLLNMEMSMHLLKLSTIEANIKDAEENMVKGKDKNARSKAELELAKALTAEARIKAEIEDKIIQRKEDLMNAKADAGVAGTEMVMFTIRKTFRDMLNDLESWTETFSNAITNVFESATKTLAEALVTGENNIAESISEALKSSAIDLIDKGFQKVLLEMLPNSLTQVMDPAQIASMQNTAALWANTAAIQGNSVASAFVGPPSNLAGSSSTATGILGTLFNWGANLVSSFFEDGGIMNHVNAYSKGTVTRRPELAIIGEGKNNEAVVPLPDNRSIPVNLNGSQGTNNSNIYVNINSDGSSDVESDNSGEKGAELAKVMTIAIKKQLMTEQRPGGLLYTGRR